LIRAKIEALGLSASMAGKILKVFINLITFYRGIQRRGRVRPTSCDDKNCPEPDAWYPAGSGVHLKQVPDKK
jgi:hypothetical protein